MATKFMATILCALIACTLMLNAAARTINARPLDLYDDVSDFFGAATLDDVPTSGRSAPEDFCRMPARKGVCRALIPRWSYNAKIKDCVEFKFGGCDGNENNFSGYKQCMDTCKGM